MNLKEREPISMKFKAIRMICLIFAAWIGLMVFSLGTSAVEAYTMTIYPGSYGTYNGSQTSYTLTEGQTITIPYCKSTTAGYAFNGYTVSGTGSTISYNGDNTYNFTMGSEDASVIASWRATVYYVSYNANGGTGSMSDSTHIYGTTSYLTSNSFTRTGYTFTGWNTSSTGSGTAYSNGQGVKAMTSTDGATIYLYAQWEVNTYTLTVDPNGGTWRTSTSSQSLSLDYKGTETITNPTRTGYTFGGWTISGTGSTISGTTFTMGSANATLTANWTANTYYVKYDANGGEGSMNTSTHTYGTTSNLKLNSFTRTGYTFIGWNTSSDGSGTSYADAQGVKAMTSTNGATITLYAQWRVYTYTVRYNANGGEGNMSNSTHIMGTESNLSLNEFMRKGYAFKYWSTELSDGEGSLYLDGATVKDLGDTDGEIIDLYAIWEPIKYTFTVYSASGTFEGDNDYIKYTMYYGQTQDIPADALIPPTGYQLSGWDDGVDDTDDDNEGYLGDGSIEGNTFTMGTEDAWITAEYMANTYYIYYNGNGATTGSMESSSHRYDQEKALTLNVYEKEDSAIFNYNYSGASSVTKMAVSDFAGWTYDTSYSSSTKVFSDGEVVLNLTTTQFDVIPLNAKWSYGSVECTPTRTGYTFGGWYTNSSCTGTRVDTVSSGKSYVMPGIYNSYCTDNTYYAKWIANTYTVKYDGNGYTSGSTASSIHTYGVSKTLTTNGFKKEYIVTYNHNYTGSINTTKTAAYTFTGWNRNSSGTSTNYADGQSVLNLTSTDGETINLYAQWNSSSVSYIPTRTGYAFEGWYTEAACTTKVTDNSYTPTADITLYAKWIANTYTVNYNGNGETGGSTENSTHTYDTAKELTANGFAREYTVTYNHNYTGSTNTSKTATYTFKNWNTVEEGTGTSYSDKASVTNLTATSGGTVDLYVQWNSSSLTYNPTREGYIFAGWYTEAECTNKVSDGTYTPTENTTLYANWVVDNGQTKELSYTVEYYKDNVKVENDTQTVTATVQILQPDTLTVDKASINMSNKYIGYVLDSLAQNAETIESIPSTVNSGDIIKIYYVKNTYILTVNPNGGTWENNTSSQNFSLKYQETKEIINPTRTGYTFGGWTVNGANSAISGTTFTIGEANAILTAKWTANSYTIKYNGNGSTSGTTANSTHIYDEDNNLTANGFTREYILTFNHNYDGSENTVKTSTYTFMNWNTVFDGAGTSYENSASVTNLSDINGDIVNLYAQWNSDSVIYIPTRIGYTFEGWYETEDLSGKRVDTNGEYTPISDVTLYANWSIDETQTKDLSYTVEYYKDNVKVEADTQVVNQTVQILQPDTLTVDKTQINTTDKYVGYKLDSENTVVPDSVNNGDIIKVYYIIDDGNTKTLTYTVEYYKDNVKVEADTQVVNKVVQSLDPDILEVDKTQINKTDKYLGYKLDIGNTNIPDSVTTGETIKIYYVIDESQTKDLSYTVEYYKDNVKVDSDTQVINKTVQILQPDTLTVDKTQINTTDKYVGYKLDSENTVVLDSVNNGDIIKVYYIIDDGNTKTLTYTVEYYKDNVKVEADTQVVNKVVQSLDPDILEVDKTQINITDKYLGYKLDSENTVVPDSVNSEETIKVYYVFDETQTKEISYTIEHIVEGKEPEIETVKETVHILAKEELEVDSDKIKPEEGYKVGSIEIDGTPVEELPEEVPNGTEIKVTYVIDESQTKDLSYTVEYYKDNVKVEADTQVVNQTVQILQPDTLTVDKTQINITDKYVGYKLDSEDTVVPDSVNSEETIKVYYVFDETQTKEISYTIEHIVEGKEPEIETVKKTVHILSKEELEVDPDKIKPEEGYNVGSIEIDGTPVEELPEEVPNGTEIKVTYVIDESQTKDLSYTVEYYKDNVKVEADTQVVNKTVQILQPYTIEVDKTKINTTDKYEGYKLDLTNTNIPNVVNDGDIIKVYYILDDGTTKDINYTIEYSKPDEEPEIETIKETVHITDPDILDLDKDKISNDKYLGYKIESIEINGELVKELPETVPSGTTIKVNYVIDESQTKDLSYIVEYYKDNVKVEDDTQVVNKTVQILQEDTLQVDKTQINTTDKYIGYKIDIENTNVPNTVNNGEVIKIYYIIDNESTKTLTYTVEYYKENIKVEADTQVVNKVVQILQPDQIEVDKTQINITDKYLGYKLDTESTNISDSVTTGETIKVYYVIDESQTKNLNYKVEYYKDNVKVNEDTQIVNKTVQVLQADTLSVNKTQINITDKYTGYKLNSENTSIPDTVPSGTVIKVYYEKIEVQEEQKDETSNQSQTIVNNTYNNITNNTQEPSGTTVIIDSSNNNSSNVSTNNDSVDDKRSDIEKTPNTGDIIPVSTISIMIMTILINGIQFALSKKIKIIK